MPSANVWTPKTAVRIIPFQDCENNTGVIMKSCLDDCCVDSTGQSGYCEKYLVRHMVKACTNCWFEETWFCRYELEEI